MADAFDSYTEEESPEECFGKRLMYLSRIFNGLCENAFRMEFVPLFVGCETLFGMIG